MQDLIDRICCWIADVWEKLVGEGHRTRSGHDPPMEGDGMKKPLYPHAPETKEEFLAQCTGISERLDIGVSFFPDRRKTGAFEDDGSLHVIHKGVRAAFGVSCDDDAAEQNETVRMILKGLGFEDLIGKRTLTDAQEGEEFCPHCGQRMLGNG